MNKKKEKGIAYKMLYQFFLISVVAIFCLLLLSFVAKQVSEQLPYVTKETPDKSTQDYIEKIDRIFVNNGELEELENLQETYENMQEAEKFQVTEARYEKIKEAIELAKQVKENQAHLIVKDKSKNGFDLDFSESDTATLVIQNGKAVFQGYTNVSGKNAETYFNNIFKGKNPFTIEAVVNPNNRDDFNMICSKGDSCAAFRFSEKSAYFFIKKIDNNWCGAKQYLDDVQMNSYLHVAGIYNGKNVATYLENNKLDVMENVGTVTESSYPLGIGYCPETQRGSNCSIEKLHIYKKALTEEELTKGTENPKSDSVALWYDFNDYIYQGLDEKMFQPKGIRIYEDLLKLEKGSTTQLLMDLVPYYAKGEVLFQSEDEKIATVSEDGFVCAQKRGRTTIKVSVKDTDFTAEIPVKVGKALFDWSEMLGYYVDNMLLLDIIFFLIICIVTLFIHRRKLLFCLGTVSASVDGIGSKKEIILPDELSNLQIAFDRAEERFKEKEREAREAERRKNDLIAYMAHDLKTPIASVIGYLTLLRDEKQISPEIHQHYVETALNNSERLDELINELFEITRFRTSRIVLKYQKINLTLMLEQLVSEFKPLLKEKHLTCSLKIPQNVSVWCDSEKMSRVFDNLFRNAINYSYPATEISIEVKDGEEITLIFRNHAKTIPEEQLEKIFEQFYRLETERSSATGGSGLGLAIAKEIVERHHGKIWAKSCDEEMMFCVCIPVEKDRTK